jgi:DNA-binding protein
VVVAVVVDLGEGVGSVSILAMGMAMPVAVEVVDMVICHPLNTLATINMLH